MREEWNGFKEGVWNKEINVENFIRKNYKAYNGDESFLKLATDKTKRILNVYNNMCREENKKHVLDIDTKTPAGITTFKPGYISKDDDVIVGLQTDKLGKRMIVPKGGLRMIYDELNAYNYKMDPTLDKF